MKDGLWSLDLFRCESIALQTYWVLVAMDQYTRRTNGFGIQPGVVDGMTLCRMYRKAIRGAGLPKYLSSDHDGRSNRRNRVALILSHIAGKNIVGFIRAACSMSTNSPGTCETLSQQGTANDLILATADDVVDIGAYLYQSERRIDRQAPHRRRVWA
jgi:hypothetical protein